MQITIENLEEAVDVVRKQHDLLMELLKFKELTKHYSEEVVGIVKLYYPRLESRVRGLIDNTTTCTELYGHSARLDYLKDILFRLLGKCIGEDLTDDRFTGK